MRGESLMLLEVVAGHLGALVEGKIIPTKIEIPWRGQPACLDLSAIQTRGPLVYDDRLLELIRLCERAQQMYGRPSDIEWAMDSQKGPVFLQIRPITKTLFTNDPAPFASTDLDGVLTGNAVSPGVVVGECFVIENEAQIS